MRQINPIMLAQMKADYLAIKQIGAPLLQCQGMLVPRGAEHMRFFFQEFPRPIVTNSDPGDLSFGGGLQSHVPGVPKTDYESSLTMLETEMGNASIFAELVVANGGTIDCDYYDGRIDRFTRAYELLDCAITFETPSMSSEGRSQATIVGGSIRFMYFGMFANIGTSGTAFSGQQALPGAEAFLNRVQDVLNVTQGAVNLANQAVGLGNAISGLLG